MVLHFIEAYLAFKGEFFVKVVEVVETSLYFTFSYLLPLGREFFVRSISVPSLW